MTVEMGKQNSLDDTTVMESFLPLSTPVTTTAGNAPGKSLYANITGKPSGKKVNVRTLFPPGGNGIDVVVLDMECGFLSQKGSEGGRGVKEKDLNRNKKNNSLGIGLSMDSEDTMNDDTLAGVTSIIQEGATPSVVDMTVEMGKQNSLDDTAIMESFLPLSTPVTTTTGNAPGKSLYANITGKGSPFFHLQA
nr:hypothetical protein [Tanacetum cinerariifolium]